MHATWATLVEEMQKGCRKKRQKDAYRENNNNSGSAGTWNTEILLNVFKCTKVLKIKIN